MSDAIFPRLAGLTWDIKMVPTWSTVVQKSKNRARTALQNDPYPLWTFELSYEFLRGAGFTPPGPGPSARNPAGYSELDQIVGFYNSMNGSFGDFLLDPGLLTGCQSDWEVNRGPVGTGDGTATVFYLQRHAAGFIDEVQDPIGAVTLFVNGSPLAATAGDVVNWTIGDAGVITFTTAPASGAVITWSGLWRYRVCFPEDSLGISGLQYQLYELQSLKLEQVKR